MAGWGQVSTGVLIPEPGYFGHTLTLEGSLRTLGSGAHPALTRGQMSVQGLAPRKETACGLLDSTRTLLLGLKKLTAIFKSIVRLLW